MPLSQAVQAHELVESRGGLGKIILDPTQLARGLQRVEAGIGDKKCGGAATFQCARNSLFLRDWFYFKRCTHIALIEVCV